MNETLKSIRERRSIRNFTNENIDEEKIEKILEAGRWAPSGKNNQPWKFKVVSNEEEKNQIADCTHYSDVVKDSQVLILIYLDKDSMYDRTKDVQSIGACCQNMCLAAHSLGVGSVWNGEILNHRDCIKEIIDRSESLELMALLCFGYPAEGSSSTRLSLDEILINLTLSD
ncbi:nitroreductase [candidate division MSBL1 archaeon SCGC-AAA382C18]|uniref:Nitroreductase n=1 Tax=candidate division MSBL1 archaeon SCGC-AAA382C18 TaxID=1698281 RepID=A0A133VKS6_9EURY|nr:nitroreductase [candidate division MSBL1 archaeon SCGC-AAA382C18]